MCFKTMKSFMFDRVLFFRECVIFRTNCTWQCVLFTWIRSPSLHVDLMAIFLLSYWKSFFVFLLTSFEEISKRKWHLDEINKSTLQSGCEFAQFSELQFFQRNNLTTKSQQNRLAKHFYDRIILIRDNANKNRDEKLENCWVVLFTWCQHEFKCIL